MFVELHILQNFAPSCLNRDETNSPKDCTFGGHRRARISSQCIKRAIRTHFKKESLIDPNYLAIRTRRLVDEIAHCLVNSGKDEAASKQVAETAAKGWGLGLKDKDRTEYMHFLAAGEIDALVSYCLEYWDALYRPGNSSADSAGDEPKTKKQRKKLAQDAVPPDFAIAFQEILTNGGNAVDVALFGRMLANQPGPSRDAACQVAHAISTNEASIEFDFFTAVDDLPGEERTGMMGTTEFNSACFYRYANIDLDQLTLNLHYDHDLVQKSVEAFIRASVSAIPTGKQNSMAAQNPPSLVFAVVRDKGLWSLANAFVNPVRSGNNGNKGGLIQKSITSLEDYWATLITAYGKEAIRALSVLAVDGELKALKDAQAANLEALVQAVMAGINPKN